MSRPAQIFISYSQADEEFRKRLDVCLASLKYEGLIATWTDRLIMPGAIWADDIAKNLNSADIVLLLVSADFIASYHCIEEEMKIALQRHYSRKARVIPIFIRPSDWSNMPFAVIQGLPNGAKPVSNWSNLDDAWLDVVQGIRKVVEEIGVNSAASLAPGNHRLLSHKASLMAGMRYAVWRGGEERSLEQALKSYFDSLGIAWDVVATYGGRLDLPEHLTKVLPASARSTIDWFDIGQLLAFLTNCGDACFTEPKLRTHTLALFGHLGETLQTLLANHAEYETIQRDIQKLLLDRTRKVEHFARVRALLLVIATGTMATAWYEVSNQEI